MAPADTLSAGDEVIVTVEAVAHGGHCVARHDGQVVFIRHTLPGERVLARVTEARRTNRFVRADAIQVLEASPDRMEPGCGYSGPGGCGGCDWQHVSLPAQRELKAQVVREQLARLGGFTAQRAGELVTGCEPLPGDAPGQAGATGRGPGLGWRTRVGWRVARVSAGEQVGEQVVGLRRHRSPELIEVQDCPIAHPGANGGSARAEAGGRADAVDAVAPSASEPVLVPLRHGRRVAPGPPPQIREQVGEHVFTLSAQGFWQVHPAAAEVLTEQVLAWLDPKPGDRVLDLYAGAGLFAVPLAQQVGPEGSVVAIEGDRAATKAAARSLQPWPWAQVRQAPVEAAVAQVTGADLVVLDPPRSGARAGVIRAIAGLGARAVVYVACDPAALARDLATARAAGLELVELRVLDAFPMTHHMECLVLLRPAQIAGVSTGSTTAEGDSNP